MLRDHSIPDSAWPYQGPFALTNRGKPPSDPPLDPEDLLTGVCANCGRKAETKRSKARTTSEWQGVPSVECVQCKTVVYVHREVSDNATRLTAAEAELVKERARSVKLEADVLMLRGLVEDAAKRIKEKDAEADNLRKQLKAFQDPEAALFDRIEQATLAEADLELNENDLAMLAELEKRKLPPMPANIETED